MEDDRVLPPIPTMIPGAMIDAGARFLDEWQNSWNGEPYSHEYLAEEVLSAALAIGEVHVQWRTTDSDGSYVTSRPFNSSTSTQAVQELARRLGHSLWYRHCFTWINGVTMQTPWEEIPYDDA